MSKPRLIVDDADGSYRIVWYFPDEGDLGAYVGQSDDLGAPEPHREKRDEWEHWKATQVAHQLGGQADWKGFTWESKAAATAALRAIKFALSVPGEMPDLAKKAIEAGWKAPRGWKP